MIGQTISHYKILEKLGGGGMGVVYKAHDLKLDRAVALKFLPPELTRDPEAKQRFVHEAKAASALDHQNICVVHDVGETDDGQIFIVMAFYDGETLKQKIDRGPLKMDEALDIAAHVAQGLAKAHAQGIVHRDLKPANIMVTGDGVAKIVDFGLAKLTGMTKLTKTGSTLGTVAYMPPEQLQGSPADARADIFSFGVVLYEMLTGVTPFRGDHEAALAYSIVNTEPEPVTRFLPEAPSELVHVLDRSLEKNPSDRYQSMDDVLIDLRRILRQSGGLSATGPRLSLRKSRRSLWIAGVSVALAILGFLGYQFLLHRPTPRLNPEASLRSLIMPYSQVTSLSISRDGNWVTFLSRDEGNVWSLYYMNLSKGEARLLTSTPFYFPEFTDLSPDGSEVLYSGWTLGKDKELFLISTLAFGSPGRSILRGDYVGARWRPDGRRIGYWRIVSEYSPPEFWTAHPDGSDPVREFVDSLHKRPAIAGIFDWSPDGSAIAWPRGFDGNSEEIFIRDLSSGRERLLTSLKNVANDLSWASNGLVLFSLQPKDARNIWAIPSEGGELVQVSKGSGPDGNVRVSADARRLLYAETRELVHVWTVGVDGSNPRQLTFDTENKGIFTPVFSPDKTHISYQSRPSSSPEACCIMITDTEGGNPFRVVKDVFCYQPSWSPDGSAILYGWRRAGEPVDSSRISLVELSDPNVHRLVGHGMGGRWLDARHLILNQGSIPEWGRIPPQTVIVSAHDFRVLERFEDSTWQFPMHDGRRRLTLDFRRGREGWWIVPASPAHTLAGTRILGPEYWLSAWPSASMNYLLCMEKNGTVWRISLSTLKREQLPGLLSGTNPHWLQGLQLSMDDNHIVFPRGRLETKVMLIDNPFK